MQLLVSRMNCINYIGEIWAYITDYAAPGVKPLSYMISNYGRAYSILSNRIIIPSLSHKGYLRIHLQLEDNSSRMFAVHRLVMLTFCPIPNSDEMQVNHITGIKTINCTNQLEWCTNQENINHAIANRLMADPLRGENNPCAMITNDQAEEIAKMITEQKYSHKEIANKVGCTKCIADQYIQWPKLA